MNYYADSEKLEQLKQKANRLPLTPGVYIMKDKSGKIIYIGKAKALKNRVTQYFGSGNQHTEKVKRMVSNVDNFEYILCDSEFEALILENSLIKQNTPKYNILLKDDKGYSYIKITDEKWRRITTSKSVEKKGEFIGPYNSSYIVKETVDEARKIFRLPDCTRDFDRISKPCLNFHIGICDAPCRGKISLDDYNETLNSAIDFIKKGDNTHETVKKLKQKMLEASDKLQFELASKYRDRIIAMEKIKQKQKVVRTTYKSEDVIASAFIGEKACVEVIVFRNYKLTDKRHFIIDGVSDRDSLYAEFLQRYYGNQTDFPQRIIIDCDENNFEAEGQWLSKLSGRKVLFINPKIGQQKQLLEMCAQNAAENLSENSNRTGKEMAVLNEIAKLLGLEKPPRYIESYDISNTSGEENVAGMIVFKDGRPFKSAYKKFKIKSFSGQDDYRSMAEVIDRRFNEYEKGADEGFSVLPDLILLDGGQGQVSAVKPILKAHGIDVPIFGMVKDSKHRTRAITAEGGDISIKSNRAAFKLVTEIQDEVHRFAIGYHRKRRTAAMLNSELLNINGIGKSRASDLLKHFKTVTAIKNATVEELQAAKGMNKTAAESVYKYFNG